MHPSVYQAFEEICGQARLEGPVLEVGAVAGPDSLLRLNALREIGPKVGLNLGGAVGDDGDEVVQGDGNDMGRFVDGQFRTVLSNATLEHDRYFWKTLAEIHRVTAAGGFIAIGVPGYAGMGLHEFVARPWLWNWLLRLCADRHLLDALKASTLTLGVHNYPGDYYRFSPQAVREVFMAGLVDVSVRTVLDPPRFIAWGRKP